MLESHSVRIKGVEIFPSVCKTSSLTSKEALNSREDEHFILSHFVRLKEGETFSRYDIKHVMLAKVPS